MRNKVMEAPKKLYVDTDDRLGESILYGFTQKRNDDDIEYIRTDAFIEKACDWLINHNDYICGSTNGIVKYDMKQLVEDFKKIYERRVIL